MYLTIKITRYFQNCLARPSSLVSMSHGEKKRRVVFNTTGEQRAVVMTRKSSPTTMGTTKVLSSYAPKEAGGTRNWVGGWLQELQCFSTLPSPQGISTWKEVSSQADRLGS